VILGVLLLSGLYDGALYFLIARNDAGAHFAYRADLTSVSAYLNSYARANPEATSPYLVLDEFSENTVHLLTTELQYPYQLLDPATSVETAVQPGEMIVFTQSTMINADNYEAAYTNVELVESLENRFGQEVMRVYKGVGVAVPTQLPTEVEGETFDLDA